MSDDADRRSALYKLLSAGFRYPTPETFRPIADGSLLAEARGLAGEPRRSPEQKPAGEYGRFAVEYVRIFDVGAPKPPCPPYEGFYRSDRARTAILLEVSEFYRHFGLGMHRQEGARELPDHVCAELEFLHFLAFKEASASSAGAAELTRGYRWAQGDFLSLHLCRWLPALCERLERAGGAGFYVELGALAARVAERDRTFLSGERRESGAATE